MSLRNLFAPMNQRGGRIARALPVGIETKPPISIGGPRESFRNVRGGPLPPISIGGPSGGMVGNPLARMPVGDARARMPIGGPSEFDRNNPGVAIGRPVAPPTNIGRPPFTPSMGGARPVQGGPLPLPTGSTERETGVIGRPVGLPMPKYETGLPQADDIVSALPVGPSIPFTPPPDTNELPTARPLPKFDPNNRPTIGPDGRPAPIPLDRLPQPVRKIGNYFLDQQRLLGLTGGEDKRKGISQPPPRPNFSDKLARPPVGPDGKLLPATPTPLNPASVFDIQAGTLGGSGYGRFPLGTAGPEYLYDDDGNPIMEDSAGFAPPLFGGPSGLGRPQPPMSIGGPGGGPTNLMQAINPATGQPYTNEEKAIRDSSIDQTVYPRQLRDDFVFAGGTPGFDVTGGNPLAGAPGFSNTGVGTSQPAVDTTGMATTTGATDSTGMTTTTAAPPAPTQPPASTEAGAGTAQATTTTTTAPPQVAGGTPFASGVTQVATGLDPLTEQLLFGLGGQGGFIPGAMRAVEKTFYDEQGNPIVIDEQVAGFTPDQLQAMQMQRDALGIQDPYLQGAGQAFGAGTQALEEGLQRGRTAAIGALEATKGGVGSLQEGLGESADILRGTLGGYDPSMTSQFYDPFEDRVVQQTITDIMEQGAKSDIGARASDIARGGESAFGSRARLGASERQEALGRGLAEALGGIRSRGFREAQQTGLSEFARQKAAERAASTGLASLAGQGFGGSQALASALSGLGQTEQDIGQQRYSGQFGLGTSLQGLGAQAAGASAADIAALYGMGSQQQGQLQAMLDAQRRNLQQRQMTPLLQYQALAPFISMAPAGQFTTTTQFAPRPSPMQSGLSTGLAAFGALGKLYGGS